jgi:DNA polymerase III sliding clamp (beta) subunit (PCNA family)
MFIRVNNKVFTEAILPALCAVTPRSALSTLSGVRLVANAEEGTLTITGYDVLKGLTTTIPAEVLTEGSMLMDGHRLAMICRSLPEGEMSLCSPRPKTISA